MAPTMKQPKLGKESEEPETPSNHLWVGNLSGETVDSDLIELFNKYGALDSVTTYSSRSFAFVYFKRVEDAKAAKDALQGASLHGNQIKIEFARPAKPCKSLWVGGISQTISKEELEEEFRKFGKIEDFKFLRDRNTAFVEYFRMEDASQAMKSMNGKRIGSEQIRVDFLRSHPLRREQWPNSHDLRDGPFSGRMGPSDGHSMAKRPHSQLGGRKGDGQPSKVLWVGYPPSVQIDEQMLHNAMILFGEIEKIKSFPSRNYAFVEFRSVEEARRAKEGLQGRLFSDPRITIMFSSSELAPGLYSGLKGPRPDMLFSDQPFRPTQMDMFGQNHAVLPNTVSGQLPPSGILGSNVAIRPFSHQSSYDPLHSGPEYNDLSAHHNMQDVDPKNHMGPNWRRPSPPLPSAQGFRHPMRQASGTWDVYDVNQLQRDAKRSRIEASFPIDDVSFPLRKIDDLGPGLDHSYGLGQVIVGGASGPFVNVQGKGRLSPVPGKVTAGGPGLACPDNDYIWRGIIAKGGTPVCQARCVPIGKGLETELPEVVNCSARTGLDMLAKHYGEAVGFDIVFFLPDSEDDFASYTEFLRYLGSKNRAGVAKFDDGMTLFLVPPSEFLTKVLKVVGPERLYGVVLKLPPPQEEQALQMEYGRVLHEDSKPPASPLGQSNVQGQLPSNGAALSQTGVALTPDLIATLASFLPTTSHTAVVSVQPPLVTSTAQSFAQTTAPKGGAGQIWNQDQQSSESAAPSFQQFNPLAQLPTVQHYSSISSTPIQSAQMVLGSTQFQESAVSLPQQGVASARSMTNFNIPSQSEHGAVSAPISQQFQSEVPSNTQKGYGMMHGADASGLYGAAAFQQPSNPLLLSNQVHGANVSQPQNAMQADRKNLEPPSQVHQLQSVLSGAGQVTSDVEVDKNQRYQSTLQFAASLLLQIQQQQQQQTNTPGGQGAGSQL
ncbi:flowering time control protein FPA-like isoform X2 [Durio zibethinus]|uniref:Flowering time control protein FPA-like isoform X2 n=1 Tax=Durio zibethinus TaxID=66656 RepID=A0A6P5Y2U5_DURZI|nr:flowering time control protein FPA-like isoform X2 [Durio zibethinus]